MPKYLDVASEEFKLWDDEDQPEGLVWNKKYQAYEMGSLTKTIKIAILSREEFYILQSKQLNKIFPEFDPKKHTIKEHTYNPENSGYDYHYVTLEEYQHDKINLPYGCFAFKSTSYGGYILKEINIDTDKYVDLGMSPVDVYKDYLDFRNSKEKFEKLGRRPRKALLLYGAPGNSKTMEICKLAKNAKKDKFRVFFIGNNIGFEGISDFKKALNNEDNVFVIEEITERRRDPEELLSFLDGEMSWSNCYTIATTNHPEELAWNLVDRPSRFKIIKEFLPPNAQQRTTYLQKVGFPEADIAEAVKLTEGMSLDYLINLSFDAMFNEQPIQKIISEYKDERKKLSKTFKNKMGL